MPTLALIVWPFVALTLFATLSPQRALILSVVPGYLLLPEAFSYDFPGFPPIGKTFVITFSALAGYLLAAGRIRQEAGGVVTADRTSGRIFVVLLAAILLSHLGTTLTNPEALVFGSRSITGLTLYDWVTMTFQTLVLFGPFFLARKLLVTTEHHRELLSVVLICGLAYSLLALFEIRMSPQLNVWVYGYFPHSWLQHIRGDGFRPVVFLKHGLWLGFFFFVVIMAAFALFRAERGPERAFFLLAGFWMFLVLVLSKVLGALALTLLFLPLIVLFPVRAQTLAALAVALAFLAYPVIRQSNVIPYQSLVTFAEGVSSDRAQSFETRLVNEDQLLTRALEKPVFGWGSWGRWRVYDETGRDRTISDGAWVIRIGETGWVGYLGTFGILIYPLFRLRRAGRRKNLGYSTAGLSLIVAGNLIYLVPNSTLSPVGLMAAGCLAGFVQFDRRNKPMADPQEGKSEASASGRYTRFAVRKPGTKRQNLTPRSARGGPRRT